MKKITILLITVLVLISGCTQQPQLQADPEELTNSNLDQEDDSAYNDTNEADTDLNELDKSIDDLDKAFPSISEESFE